MKLLTQGSSELKNAASIVFIVRYQLRMEDVDDELKADRNHEYSLMKKEGRKTSKVNINFIL